MKLIEIARWHSPRCVCLPGCKNAKETLLLLLYFQQLLTFSCNLFAFSPLLKNITTSTILIINQWLSCPKDLSAEDCFCQQRVPKLRAHGRLVERIPCKTQPAAHLVRLSTTLPFVFPAIRSALGSLSFPVQGPSYRQPAKIPFQSVSGVFFDGFLLHFYLSEVLKTPTSHKVFLTFMAFRSWVSKNR